MIIYRAMCEEEYLNTLKKGAPDFLKRKKWFTPNKDFLNRVLDGKFNNSSFKDKYTHLVVFEVSNIECCDWFNSKEIQIDRRSLVTFKIKSYNKL